IENYNESYLNDIFQKIPNFKKNKFFSILKYKLYIGDIKSNLFFNKCIKSFNKKKSIKVAKSKLNNNSPKIKKPDFKNIVALLHFARSGTGLMHSLIDDHSEVSTLPSIYFSHFFDKSMWEKIITDGCENIIDNFISAYPVFFDARSSRPVADKKDYIENVGIKEGMTNLGNGKNEYLYIDKNLFKTELASMIKKYDNLDQMTFFKLVHLAYEKVINNHHKKEIIFYHIHNPRADVLFNFINHAPNAKWLVMVRDPVEGCEAWISQLFNENNYTDIVQRIVAVLLDVNNNLYKNRDVVGLRLEDLKYNPRYIIPLLCSWMGIKEEETLYKMTAQGKKWWGDKSSPEQEAFGKISKKKLGTVFNVRDRFILETLFYPFRVKFNYVEENTKRYEKDLKVVRPMINEVFDFEKKIINQLKINTEQFKKSEMFLYFRSILIERWNILNQSKTYPNMLKKLQ
ncbi:MAG: hypothetical protein VX089_01335, partial [Pseudomonadota bacterium]|nr:hypothetical protein [Pseudomonadota bacterium]